MTGYIARDKLTDTLRSHRNTPEIKVLTGVRRCGKSTLLEHYAQSLLDDGVPASNIFTRRFDSFDTPIGYSATDLHADLMQATQESRPGPFYVFLDEIQDVPGWEEVVRRLHSRDDTDVYITGSNARLLSGELATHLTGRYITIPVYPLSFDEYQRHHRAQGTTDSTDQLFSKYMMFGGMPGLFATGQPDQDKATEILTSIYESIVMKDVAGRYGIRDIATLEKLSRYLFSTSGNLFSVNKVANTLTSTGANASYATVDNQISALERSFIVYSAQQERMRGKELLRPQRKFYPVDNGFRNLATGFNGSDRGAQLEGIVFMELQRRGYDVTIGSLPDGEIDFIAKRGNNKQYIQVTLNMTEEQTRERELDPLRRLGDAFPRTVLTLDWHSEGMTDEGIHITNVMDWLCS
ncbi:ATP-binding protein [Bifidobacterium breve]|uniref:ATP-binding protein n=1 Tax=Bifidobacterium breve TaxID=1685 RepID=UPI001373F277|nr:ATP-binding protein [Bifidobacterium breve]QHP51960.1 ATP-binding protein [Bifidobacterium breve]